MRGRSHKSKKRRAVQSGARPGTVYSMIRERPQRSKRGG